jgi:iron complex outermembrane receptor protein
MNTRVLFTLLLTTLFLNFNFSQNTISGKVVNSKNEVISNCKIIIKALNLSTLSDKQGFFQFKNIPSGKFKIIVKNENFINYEKQIDVKDGQVLINVVLIEKSLKTNEVDEVFVNATRANNSSGTTYSTLNKEQIKAQNFAQDLPYLLETTPSTVVTSDAGAGVGYTGVKIRGVDPTRTNVTVNGIPLNDSESHAVYWVNMPDFASSVNNLQIQRGVGTSTNGAASFGASINVQTDKINKEAYCEVSNTYGSFNTWKNSIKVGSGLLNNKFAFDLRLSRVKSDGYIDRASSDLKSYFISGAYVGKKSLLKLNVFSGKEITYQAWYGVPEAKLIGNNDSLLNHFYNNYYPGGVYQNEKDSTNLFSSKNRTYNYYRYDNEVDNYQQNHYQLLYNFTINPKFKINLAGHYTHGEGYYEQFRQNDDFETYNLTPIDTGLGQINSTDLIRRRWLDNDFYGGVFSFEYNTLKSFSIMLGGAINQYEGKHFGEIIWAEYASQSEIRDHYYDNKAKKIDGNVYLKMNKKFNKLNTFLDLQLRTISYSYLGIDESNGQLIEAQQKANFTFFNPKFGLNYDINATNQVYTSFSIANREPVRDDFRENLNKSQAKFETLQNLELGYRLVKNTYFFKFNYYLMYYYNQLILTGQINDVGGYTRTNVNYSYRNGIEIETGKSLFNKVLQINANANLSQNKIINFIEYVDDYDNGGQQQFQHKNTDLAFSPNIILGLNLIVEPITNFKVGILSKYVGKQFLDNTSTETRSINSYYITNLTLSYTTTKLFAKEIEFGILVNNIFNYMYENNGYTWGYIYGGKRTIENFYFPQAGINCLGRIVLSF